MQDENKEQVREEIKRKLDQTRKAIASLREQTKPIAPDRAIGRLTRMDAIQQKSVSEATLRSSEEALHNLEEALEKLDQPGFGTCVICKQTIPLGRILLVPESRLCVTCASARQK